MPPSVLCRIGPKMTLAAQYVAANPGCTKASAARHVWRRERGWQRYGYAAVDRAIAAGLIRASRAPNGIYSLTAAEVRQ